MVIHMVNSDGNYECNQACSVISSKIAHSDGDVTCKNCLRILERRGPIVEPIVKEFRAWHIPSHCMIEWELLKMGLEGKCITLSNQVEEHSMRGGLLNPILNEMFTITPGEIWASPDIIIDQYINIRDRNGNKIYENDIVKTEYDKELVIKLVRSIVTGFYACYWSEDADWETSYCTWDQCEVIGNVHKDRKLLRKIKHTSKFYEVGEE